MKLYFQVFIFVVCSPSIFANGIIKFEGSISKTYDGCEVLFNYRDQTNSISASSVTTIVRKGKFQLVAELLNEFELVALVFKQGTRTLGAVSFFAASGIVTVNVTTKRGMISGNDIYITNAEFVKEKRTYDAIQNEMSDTLSFLFNKLSRHRKEKLPNRNYDSLLAIYHSKERRFIEQQIAFFKIHPTKYVSLFYFHRAITTSQFFRYPVDSLLQIYREFDATLHSSPLGQVTFNYLLKRKSLLLQAAMPDFTLKTIEGENFQLSSFREKQYVLLCFWASWCNPCIKSLPFLREIDSLYSKKGLQMISISIDTDSTKWFNSLKKHKLPWMQGCDLVPYVQQDKTIRFLYDLRFIPQYFLVDKEGRLIYHNIQLNDNDDFSVLQSVLNKVFR
jgi:peroxiredoxin